MKLQIPNNYRPLLNPRQTEGAIKEIKDFFQMNLASELRLRRVTAPLFVQRGMGINDDLNGVERAVSFPVKDMGGQVCEIVHSLAKWKRLTLAEYGIEPGYGIYTDMNAIRADEELDNVHSLYVDQWDWERVMLPGERNPEYLKDIVRRKNVRNVSLLDNLARFVADNSGKVFSANSIAKYLKGSAMAVSANTVGEYMDALCDTYMIDRVKRYDIKGKSVFEQQDKYYFEDLGLRNYLCRDKRSLDMEKVLEGAVYLKLRRSGYEVYVGQLNGKEIDFLARRGDEVIYVQVALQVTGEETYEREFGNLKLIKDNYPKYVVTMDPNVGLIHDSGIVACSARQFLLNS